jgi:hypothetical protein
MFEDFRKQIEDASFPDDVQKEGQSGETLFDDQKRLFGLTPTQRFFIALMLLIMTVILGILFLLVTSKIAPPLIG